MNESNNTLVKAHEEISQELNRRTKLLLSQSPKVKVKKNMLILSICLVTIALILFTLTFIFYISKPTEINHYNTIENPTEIIKVTEKTIVENIIKGEKYMTCIGDPNERKQICYKEVK